MSVRRALFCFFFLLPFCAVAQGEKSSEKIPRILFLLDGSSSMSEDWSVGKTRFQQARTFILNLVDSLSAANSEVEFGLRIFGHQYPAQEKNCYDTKLEIKFSRYSGIQMSTRLEALRGYGVSPIAFSLSEAALEDFENENKYAYSIILVTDGGESCGGDICAVVSKLLQRKIFFKPYIVSLLDYAPLKDMYACLGTFLTVANPTQQAPAISKIVDGHREGFVRAKTGKIIPVMPVQNPKVETARPDAKPAQVPGEIIIPLKLIYGPDSSVKAVPADSFKEALPKKIQAPREKKTVKHLQLKAGKRTFRLIEEAAPIANRLLIVPPFAMSQMGNRPPEAAKPLVRERLKSVPVIGNRRYRLPKLLTVSAMPKLLTVPPMVMSKWEKPAEPAPISAAAPKPAATPTPLAPAPKPAPKPTLKPTVTKPAPVPPANYTQEKTAAEDTYLEVVFTDGNGKYYATSPQIQLSDPQTGKSVKTFYRTVDPNGTPDPVKVTAGVYDLSVVGSDRTFLKSVTIAERQKNKIIITVGGGSLQFVWRGGTNKGPVSKYIAQVKRNFVPQPMVTQRCDTVLPYPPGNYHIEISTNPVSVRSLDLNFGATAIIPIDEPGLVQITNTENLGKATLYYQRGDRFLQFAAINVSGNPESQSMELLPGLYEIHYILGPGLPEKVIAFHVYSNKTTSIELKL